MIRAEAQADLIRVNDGAQGQKGDTGATGESISSITNYYLATAASSGITRESSGWTTTVQSMDSTNQFLWNYEVVIGDKGTILTTTNPTIIGRYGLNGSNGKGISSITEYYLATNVAAGVTTTTSGWTTSVQTTDATNKYLWNYEVISYTSGNPYTSSPKIIGTYGDKGDKGDTPEITASKSGTTTTIKVDGETVATVSDGAKGDKGDTPSITASKSGTTTTVKVDGATVATISDGAKGDKGDKGEQGIQGPQGNDGNDAAISVSKTGNTTTITAVSGDGTTTTTTVNDGTNGKSAYQSAVSGGYTGTENKFNTDLADVSNKAPLTIIREYNDGVLVGKVGQSVGALVNANGTFDVVNVTWNNNVPTAGAIPFASYGNTSVIGKSNSSHVKVDSNSLQLIDSEQQSFFEVKDLRDSSDYATITESVRIVKMAPNAPTGTYGGWDLTRVTPDIALTFNIEELLELTINGNEISDLSGIRIYNEDYPTVIYLTGTFENTGSSYVDIIERFNTTTLANGTIIIDNDSTITVKNQTTSQLELEKIVYSEAGGRIQLTNSIFNDNVIVPTGNVQVAYTDVVIKYKTSDSSAKYVTFGTRNDNGVKGGSSASFGMNNTVSGANAFASGHVLTASGFNSFASGYNNVASGKQSHVEGLSNTASGMESHAEGYNTVASNNSSHSEGENTSSTGYASHAEGNASIASGNYSHAEGKHTHATVSAAHAEGSFTSAEGESSHSEGNVSMAYGAYSHAQNLGTIAVEEAQTALGKYNDFNSSAAIILGNGSDLVNTSNALIVDWNGNIMSQGMAGMVQMYAGATPPSGWLLCDGSAVSRTEYAELFAAIGTTWGAGDGSTTFNVPDMRGRAPVGVGQGSGLTNRALAATGGDEHIQAHTHAHTNPSVSVSGGAHVHNVYARNAGTTGTRATDNLTYGASGHNYITNNAFPTGYGTHTHTVSVSGGGVGAVSGATTGNAGNMMPFRGINFIIATGKTCA